MILGLGVSPPLLFSVSPQALPFFLCKRGIILSALPNSMGFVFVFVFRFFFL